MSDILVTSPYRPFTLPNQFKAVFNGFIYCGTVDAVDPSVSQVQVYVVNEDGSRIPVAQPLRTNAGGFLVFDGQPAKFVTDSNYSLLVRDSLGNQLWYAPDVSVVDPESLVNILNGDGGADFIGTSSGDTVQGELDKLSGITDPSGSDKLGFKQDGANSVDRPLIDKAKERYSVGDKGGNPGATDSSPAFQAAVDDLDTGDETITGGRIHAQIGKYTLSNNVIFKNSQASRLSGLTIEGDGKQGTTLDFESAPDVQDGLVFEQPVFCRVADLAVQKAGLAGIKLKGIQSGFGAWNHFNMQRVRTGFNGTYGVDCERGFMGHFEQVFATHAGAGAGGFRFQGLHTSMHLNNCYAASNGGSGYNINQFTYSVLNACASDSSAIYGYLFTKTHSTIVNGCGSESNGRSGFAAFSSTAQGENVGLTFNSIFGYQNNQANAGYPNLLYVAAADGVRNKAVLRGSYSQSPANGAVDVLVTGVGAYLVDEDNECPAGVVSQNGGYVHHVNRAKVVRSLSVTAATTVVELSNPQGHQTDFSGEITIVATNASPELTTAKNSAVYKLLVVKGSPVVVVGSAGLTAGASASHPSFTWTLSGNNLQATPVGSTSGSFFFQLLCNGPAVRVKTY